MGDETEILGKVRRLVERLAPADPDALLDDEDPLTDIDLEELGLLTPRVEDD